MWHELMTTLTRDMSHPVAKLSAYLSERNVEQVHLALYERVHCWQPQSHIVPVTVSLSLPALGEVSPSIKQLRRRVFQLTVDKVWQQNCTLRWSSCMVRFSPSEITLLLKSVPVLKPLGVCVNPKLNYCLADCTSRRRLNINLHCANSSDLWGNCC